MNYQKHYDLLIQRAALENRKKYEKSHINYIYYEKHHIIPKCMGRSNIKSNLVELTPEEHFLAHQLLVKIYPEQQKLIFAVHRMCSGTERNNKMFGWLRRQHADAMSDLHLGKIMSTDTRTKMSSSKKGKPKSIEAIQNMTNAQQNRSDKVRKNMSDAKMGHEVSIETRAKIRENNLGKLIPTKQR